MPTSRLPLIRPLSRWALPLLLRSGLSANAVTTLSLFTGAAALWSIAQGKWELDVAAGILLVVSYVFDNCDGDVARARNQCSAFGRRYDSFVDWAINGGFFLALGIGVTQARGETVWVWLGAAALAGGTVNYVLGGVLERLKPDSAPPDASPEDSPLPQTGGDWAIFIFRELFRADFCFIVLGCALAGWTWVLVPAGAVGAQVYWISLLFPGAGKYHV